MIVSYKNKFIFLHCRKTAGSSITVSLTRYLGQSDIVLGSITDCIRQGVRPPRRMLMEALRHPKFSAIYKKLIVGEVWNFVSSSNKSYYSGILGEVPQHAPAKMVSQAYEAEWAEFTKFCVVRNPWCKTLSDYYWKSKGVQDPPSFSDFVKALSSGDPSVKIVPLHNSNWDMCAIDDKICVDRIIRFEDLNNGLNDVIKEIGIDWDGWLPQSKLNSTKKIRQYRDYYDSETRNIISDIYGREIDHFNYRF
ncbi:sulfotransferase family 2 domain-containing protein [Pararhizobium sp. IMCC21322]|uniref:sulfotransferase family 2 domain-containing protein n=1 Tax=Pararhizobium sp. IMCC21322 TaxID=3067903 RepID=UPI0027428976|nr:sulfotransferase family 2 domain-containing protein [Pararhizobium sp. IMCC21322]